MCTTFGFAARRNAVTDLAKDPKGYPPSILGLGVKKVMDKRKKSKQPTAAPKTAKAATTQNTSNTTQNTSNYS